MPRGWRDGPVSRTGCQPRPNGNTPHARAQQPATVSATTRQRCAHTRGSPISVPGSAGATLVAAKRSPTGPSRLGASSRIHGASSTCTATLGSGWRIAGHQTRRKSLSTDQHPSTLAIAKWESFEAAAGPPAHAGYGRRCERRYQPRHTTTTTDFGSLSHSTTERTIRQVFPAHSALVATPHVHKTLPEKSPFRRRSIRTWAPVRLYPRLNPGAFASIRCAED